MRGGRIERGFGGAIFEVEERRGHAPVIFREKEDKCLLGGTTLEALGLEVAYETPIALTGNERGKNQHKVYLKKYIYL